MNILRRRSGVSLFFPLVALLALLLAPAVQAAPFARDIGSFLQLGASAGAQSQAGTYATAQIDNVTLEMWVLLADTTGAHHAFFNGNGASSGYGLYLSGATVNVLLGSVGWIVCSTGASYDVANNGVLVADRWMHIAATRNTGDGGTFGWKIYVDGQPLATQFNPAGGASGVPLALNTSSYVQIGRALGDSPGLSVSEARIWTRALTQAEIQSNLSGTVATNATNLVGYWKLADGSGTTVADIQTNVVRTTPLHLPITGPVAWIASTSGSTAEDTPLSGRLAGGDDLAGLVTYAKASDPTHGTVTVEASGAYHYTPAAHFTGSASFSFKVNNGTNESTARAVTITVSPVNDAPTATNLTQTVTYAEDPVGAVALADIVVTDVDIGDAITATLTLSNPAAGALTTGTYGSATSSYNAGTGVWTVTGSVANVNAALAAVAFTPATNWDVDTTLTTRIRDAANTGPADGTITLDVTPVNDAPIASITSATYPAIEQTTLTLKGTGLAIGEVDTGGATAMTVTLSVAEGVLNATAGDSGATVAGDGTASVTLSGTLTQINALLGGGGTGTLSYINHSDTPPAAVTLTLHVSDGALTGSDTAIIQLTAVNDSPTLAINTGASTEIGGLITLTPAMLNGTDPDDSGVGLIYTITGATESGTLFLDAKAAAVNDTFTQDDIDHGRIKYQHSGGAGGTDRFNFALADGGEDGSVAVTGQAFHLAIAERPVVVPSGGIPAYVEDHAAVVICAGLTLVDGDSANLQGATITMTDFVEGDILGFVDQNGITGSFDAATGVLTLTGAATPAQYQAALRSLTYHSSNNNPATGAGNTDRVIAFVVNDGALESSQRTVTVTVANSNDAPVLDPSLSPVLTDGAEDAPAPVNGSTAGSTLVSALLEGATDVDAGAVKGMAIVGTSAQGVLWYSTNNGDSWTQVPAVTATSALLLRGDARLYFQPAANVNGVIADALTFKAWDCTSGSNGAIVYSTGSSAFSTASDTVGILISAVNDAPSGISLSARHIAQTAGVNAEIGTLSTKDPDHGDTHTYSFVAGDGDDQNALFAISGAQLRVHDAAALPLGNSFVRIRSTDADGLHVDQTFTIAAGDGVAPALSAIEFTQVGANQVTLNLRASETGTGYFTLLAGGSATVGNGAQTKAGQDSTGAAALRFGSRPLVANATGAYTVRNLTANTAYTVSFTADDGSTLQPTTVSASFTTSAAPPLTGREWIELGSGAFSSSARDLGIACAPDGTPYAAFSDGENSDRPTVLRFAGGSWERVGGAVVSEATAINVSLAFAPDGTPHLAYRDDNHGARVTLKKFNGTTWELVGSAGFSAGVANDIALAFAPDGAPHVAFSDGALVRRTTVMKLTDNGWTVVGAAGFSGEEAAYLSFAFAADGTPWLALRDIADEVSVMRFDGTAWVNVGAAFGPETARPSFAFAPDGTAHVAFVSYATSGGTRVNKWNGGGWVTVGPGTVAPHAMPGMAFAADGSPCVVYIEGGSKDGGHLKLANLGPAEADWTLIGNIIATGVYAVEPAFAPDGSPLIAYVDDFGNATVITLEPVPAIASVTTPAPATYGLGSTLNFTVVFDTTVAVNTAGGRPRLTLTVGATTRSAEYVSGSGTTSLVFGYTVRSGDADPDGIVLAASVDLAGGAITSVADSLAAVLTLNGVGATGGIRVDGTPPPSPPKQSQSIVFGAIGEKSTTDAPFALSASASSGLPVSFSIVSGPASLSGSTVTLTGAPGSVTIRASQSGNGSYDPAPSVEQSFAVGLAAPVVTTPTQVPAPSPGGTATLNTGTGGVSGLTYRWQRNGRELAGATGATLMLTDMQPPAAGLYTYTATTPAGAGGTSTPVIVGVATADKVAGTGAQVGADIQHPNGNVYDQLLLEGAGASLTADPGQITRMSFVDLSDDIVQVEFSGAGTLSLVMDGAPVPAAAANYNQPGVNYVRGNVGIVITGADETTNVAVFSVGRITAVNQTLFRDDVAYDGVANIAFIAIQSSNGRFGGVRTGNVEYFAAQGFTGVYAPGVTFAGPINIGDIQAFDDAQPLLVVGSASNVRIAGGNLAQPNSQPIRVDGLTQLTMAPGQTSQGGALPAQTNQGVFQQDGVDVTDLIVERP